MFQRLCHADTTRELMLSLGPLCACIVIFFLCSRKDYDGCVRTGSGYTLHIRPADEQPAAAAVLRHFINVVNHRDGPPPGELRFGADPWHGFIGWHTFCPGAEHLVLGLQVPRRLKQLLQRWAIPPHLLPRSPIHRCHLWRLQVNSIRFISVYGIPFAHCQMSVRLNSVIGVGAGESDEELARRLQEYYNQEAGTPLSRPPKPAPQLQSHPLPATPTSSTELPNSTPPPVRFPCLLAAILCGGTP